MPSLFGGDPISGTIGAILMHKIEDRLMDLLYLSFELAIGALGSFLVFAGTTYASTGSWVAALGIGMTVAGVAIIATVQASKHAKALTISFVQKTDLQIPDSTTTTKEEKK